jgi:hypothetical protein
MGDSSSQKHTPTKKEDIKWLAEKNFVTLDTSIEELISIIFAKLRIDVPRDEYVKKFHDNLIFDVGHLKRITPHRLGKLNLPILLEEELEKVIGKPKSEFTKSLISVSVKRERSSSSHSDGTPAFTRRNWIEKSSNKDEQAPSTASLTLKVRNPSPKAFTSSENLFESHTKKHRPKPSPLKIADRHRRSEPSLANKVKRVHKEEGSLFPPKLESISESDSRDDSSSSSSQDSN